MRIYKGYVIKCRYRKFPKSGRGAGVLPDLISQLKFLWLFPGDDDDDDEDEEDEPAPVVSAVTEAQKDKPSTVSPIDPDDDEGK